MSSGRLACDSESCCERRASAVLEHSRGSGPRGALCVHKRAQKRSSARCAVAAVSPSDAAPERPRVPLGSAQRFERFVDLLQLVFVRGTRRQLSPRERPV